MELSASIDKIKIVDGIVTLDEFLEEPFRSIIATMEAHDSYCEFCEYLRATLDEEDLREMVEDALKKKLAVEKRMALLSLRALLR